MMNSRLWLEEAIVRHFLKVLHEARVVGRADHAL